MAVQGIDNDKNLLKRLEGASTNAVSSSPNQDNAPKSFMNSIMGFGKDAGATAAGSNKGASLTGTVDTQANNGVSKVGASSSVINKNANLSYLQKTSIFDPAFKATMPQSTSFGNQNTTGMMMDTFERSKKKLPEQPIA